MLARFARDERLVKESRLSLLGKGELEFRDDGTDGDDLAGDGVFTARTALSFESVEREHKRLLEHLEKAGGFSEPQFVGRQVAGATEPLAVARSRITETARGFPTDPWSGALRFPPSFLAGVDAGRSLMITDLKVVEDPKRTYNPCTGAGTQGGKWTFGHLARAMAGAGDPALFVATWLEHWLADQTVNAFTVPARPTVQQLLDAWPKTASGALDLDRAPFKLLAIVNRIDLAGNPGYAPGGEAEGRFVFQWVDPITCTEDPTAPLLLILEYGVPNTSSCEDLRLWAWGWKLLGFLPVGSAAYNAALELVTDRFARANAAPGNPNGSALNQLRTNDFKLVPLAPAVKRWELREFRIQPAGTLAQVTLGPRITINNRLLDRPVLRALYTRAFWSRGLRGAVGGPAHVRETAGSAFMLQVESWW